MFVKCHKYFPILPLIGRFLYGQRPTGTRDGSSGLRTWLIPAARALSNNAGRASQANQARSIEKGNVMIRNIVLAAVAVFAAACAGPREGPVAYNQAGLVGPRGFTGPSGPAGMQGPMGPEGQPGYGSSLVLPVRSARPVPLVRRATPERRVPRVPSSSARAEIPARWVLPVPKVMSAPPAPKGPASPVRPVRLVLQVPPVRRALPDTPARKAPLSSARPAEPAIPVPPACRANGDIPAAKVPPWPASPARPGPPGYQGPQGRTGSMGAPGTVGIVAEWTAYRDFYFARRTANLQPSETARASDIAAYLAQNPSLDVAVDASWDARGSRELSARRAASVRDALLQAGVPAYRFARSRSPIPTVSARIRSRS